MNKHPPDQRSSESAEPWNGKSPRTLTRAYERFSLSSEGTGRANLEPTRLIESVQLELFPEGTHYGT